MTVCFFTPEIGQSYKVIVQMDFNWKLSVEVHSSHTKSPTHFTYAKYPQLELTMVSITSAYAKLLNAL